jgi:hypothetical protein
MSVITANDGIVAETDASGNERIAVPERKLGVLVVEGSIERLTGAGKFVVAPIREHTDVAVGNRVMVVVLDKLQPEVELMTFKDRVTTPFPSNWAIVVTGNRFVERCNVYYNGNKLSALDASGVTQSELKLPRDGVLNFRIPETVNVENDETVEVRDGDRLIRSEPFGLIRVEQTKEAYPTVTVSGKLSPTNNVENYPESVDFTNMTTRQRYSAPVTNGEYSIQLPNREFYQVTVTWRTMPGDRTGTAQAGTLNLDANYEAHPFDASW